MAGSFVAWVDYSLEERDRMRRAIALFKETETVDELGLGMIRDALADQLFPGTSTIQTRLRYFLIVPWIYVHFAGNGHVKGSNVARRVRELELDLIEPLTLHRTDGVFGAVSGRTIQRLPSSVYWNGLRRWGILREDISQDELHRRWDHIRAYNRRVVLPDDAGMPSDFLQVWDKPPPIPRGWSKVLSLDVTRKEAQYLKERMASCQGSVLAHLATVAPDSKVDVEQETPWDAIRGLPPVLAQLLDQASALARLMWGAGLLYSLDLCEHSHHEKHKEQVGNHRGRLAVWMSQTQGLARAWNPNTLWEVLGRRGVAVSKDRPDRAFVDRWCALAAEIGTDRMIDNGRARALIRDRERSVKRSRSRYGNPRALDRWGGDSGTRQIDYRWRTVRRLLTDLYDGLERPE